jgi:hypothetical protein
MDDFNDMMDVFSAFCLAVSSFVILLQLKDPQFAYKGLRFAYNFRRQAL